MIPNLKLIIFYFDYVFHISYILIFTLTLNIKYISLVHQTIAKYTYSDKTLSLTNESKLEYFLVLENICYKSREGRGSWNLLTKLDRKLLAKLLSRSNFVMV